MTYTEAEIEEIANQLMRIKVNGERVFIAIIEDTSGPYHKIYVDAGVTVARFEFLRADEPIKESEAQV